MVLRHRWVNAKYNAILAFESSDVGGDGVTESNADLMKYLRKVPVEITSEMQKSHQWDL